MQIPGSLPHLRARRIQGGPYRSPRGYSQEQRLPQRNPADHAERLLANLNAVEQQIEQLVTDVIRPPQAEGHLVTAEALEETNLATSSLADRRTEAVVVAESADRAVIHLRRDDLRPLRRKIAEYGDPERITPRGRPRNQALVAPLEGVRLATIADLSEGTLTEASIDPAEVYWVELWARGGRLEEETIRSRVREEIEWLAAVHEIPAEQVRAFRATERDVFLLPLPGEALLDLPHQVPDVYRVVETTPALRDLLVSERQAELVQPDNVGPPPADAPAVVIIDTGIAPQHPLLAPSLIGMGHSVIVGDASPVDTHGHGTEMAGIAAYRDLGDALTGDIPVRPRVRLQNIRLIASDQTNDDDREFWPERTENAVAAAEADGNWPRVFNLCISAENRDPPVRTSWSVALDLLAHNDSSGRLFCTAIGNVTVSPTREFYPNLNLTSFVDDPGQAINVLTIGALTERITLPADQQHGELAPLAEEGALSPYARCGVAGSFPIKPEIVLEGGNCAPDGDLPNVGLETLSVLTTSHRHAEGRPLTFSWASSAACASASGLVAEVWNANPGLRPETIRALVVHSARWHPAIQAQFPDRRDLVRAAGYGTPDVEAASWSHRTRPTLLVEDRLLPASNDEDGQRVREHHLVQLPLPHDELLELGEHEVELSVTLSYFIEPNEANRANYAGASLRWDVQRSGEDEEAFRQRINRLVRDQDYTERGVRYPWEIGPELRGRGSVQSDRCRVPAASLAGERLIAVYPVLGWWEGRPQRADASVPYGLVVTIDAGDVPVDLYALIEAQITVDIPA